MSEKKKDEKIKEIKKEENKKQKAPWIIPTITAVVVIALAVLLTIMIVTSSDPKKTVDSLFMNLKAGEFEQAKEFITSDEVLSSELFPEDINVETQKLLVDKLNWKLTKITENGDEATVELEVTNKNFKTILANVMQKTFTAALSGKTEETEQTVQNYLIEELKNDQVETTTVSKTLKLVKQDKKWKVVADEELINVVLPGLQEAIDSLNK